MNKLVIKNIGPLTTVLVDFAKYNLFIGPQSSGKSCILKIASYCNWVEKRIELSQSPNDYLNEFEFWKRLVDYHRLNGFIKKGFLIKYESSYMAFSISGSPEKIQFSFKWKPRNRWQYSRPQIAYIPALWQSSLIGSKLLSAMTTISKDTCLIGKMLATHSLNTANLIS